MQRARLGLSVNRASVARSISSYLGASKGVEALAAGISGPDSYIPETEGQYWQFRRFLHDILCDGLVDNGTFKAGEFNISHVGLKTNNRKINTQRPDLHTLSMSTIHLAEVSATYNTSVEYKRKSTKYADLIEFLTSNGFDVHYDVILLDLTDPEWEERFANLSSIHKSMLTDFISCLKMIHSLPKFANVRSSQHDRYNVSRFQYQVEDSTLVDQLQQATGEEYRIDEIRARLDSNGKENMPHKEYIECLARSVLSNKPLARPYPEPRPVNPVTMMSEFQKMLDSKPTTQKLPRILQLGLPSKMVEHPLEYRQSILSLRSSGHTGGYLDLILMSLQNEEPDDHRFITLSLSTEQLEREQLSGPGRKAYLRKRGITIPREEPRHIGLSPGHESQLHDFITQLDGSVNSSSIKELSTPGFDVTGLSMSVEIEVAVEIIQRHPTSGVLMFYQAISNEIVLNSMRRRKSRQYVLCYSGFKDVYFIIAPGPQLRTESNIEFIKVISLVPGFPNQLCAPWHRVNDHWESDWLSVDVDRLKHWQRAFDRVSVSLLANAERLVTPNLTFRQSLKEEIGFGNYTFLALTYLEDKHLTSVTNQTLRYLWMKSLGDKEFEGLASKFPSRVNSVIQSTMLQRSIRSCKDICTMSLTDLVKTSRVNRDNETGLYDETTTGITNLLPRIFTFGRNVPISYNLNEIYWCMAYNKDRQNAAQDAMNILSKIVKEESKYNVEIGRRDHIGKLDYFLGHTSVEEDIAHSFALKPESHYYSQKAVRVGLWLQDNHKDNMGEKSSWMNSERLEAILSKPLSEFATFKASVDQICENVNPHDLAEIKKIGVRTKAIELVSKIIESEGLMTSADLAMKFSGAGNKSFKMFIQIFKKGQIGGVREILIMYIKARVMMNIVEEIARLLCKSDRREILTKGRDKRLMMRGDHEEVCSYFPDGTPIQVVKESYDMTVWAQKFIPTIFIPIHRMHFDDHPGMSDLATHVFLAHSNKKIEYPVKLVEQWMRHPDTTHKDQPMQDVKMKFLQDGVPNMVNHSNMGQGLPHYNSSVLALSCISLGEAIFEECLLQTGQQKAICWRTRVGSDDKGTIISIDLSNPHGKAQAKLLGQCTRVSERLHSMELSIKSASGHVMYELNSAYMANLETLSPTIKYSLASTDTIETTSCSTFVNESYSRIRQMRENGCSSLICLYAHMVNRRHFESIFDTGFGGTNDVCRIFNMPREKIPFDFGVYPMYDCDLQDLIGPELHNYRIFRSNSSGSNPALKLLYTSITKDESDEIFSADDTPLLKKDHFGIKQGLVRQLVNMRRRVNADGQKVEEFFEKNPFLLIRGPETVEETLMTVKSKLFTKGAAQSLRRTSPAIYIGRLSAFRSSKSWSATTHIIPSLAEDGAQLTSVELQSNLTYAEYLQAGLKKVSGSQDLDTGSLCDLLFPQNKSLEIVLLMVGKFGAMKTNSKRFSQAVRTWTINNFNYEYTSGLKSILQTSFGDSTESSKSDVAEFKKLVGFKLSSLDSFISECHAKGVRPLDMFFYLNKLHSSSRTSRVQTFGFGPSTQSLHLTAMTLKKYNHIPGMVSVLESPADEEDIKWANTMAGKLDSVKLLHNLIVMERTDRLTYIGHEGVNAQIGQTSLIEEVKTIVRGLRSISGLDYTSRKSLKLVSSVVLDDAEFREKLIEWKDTNFTYLKKQKRTVTKSGQVNWSGNLSVLVSSDNECFVIEEQNSSRRILAKAITDPHSFHLALKEMCRTLGMEVSTFFKRTPMAPGTLFLSDSTKKLHRSEVHSESANVLQISYRQDFPFKRLVDLVDFRVVRQYDSRSRVFTVHLEDVEGRTTTVCHNLGNYYPVEVPRNLTVSEECMYQGVRLARLLENRDWFFNHRLPTWSPSKLTSFLRYDVDYQTVLSLDTRDLSRIHEYAEVREEVNEDSFAIVRAAKQLDIDDFEDLSGSSINYNELFRMEIEKELKSSEATDLYSGPMDWAEDMDDELAGVDTLLNLMADEDTVLATRAMAYKKPLARKSAHTMSSLQQGAELKHRILDSFFHNGSINFEMSRSLPYYMSWLIGTADEMCKEFGLVQALIDHISSQMSVLTGTPKSSVEDTIRSHKTNIMETPILRLHSLMAEETAYSTDENIMNLIMEASEDFQQIGSDDEEV